MLVFSGVSNIQHPQNIWWCKWIIYSAVTLNFIFGPFHCYRVASEFAICKDISKNTCDIIKEKEISLADNGIVHARFTSFT